MANEMNMGLEPSFADVDDTPMFKQTVGTPPDQLTHQASETSYCFLGGYCAASINLGGV